MEYNWRIPDFLETYWRKPKKDIKLHWMSLDNLNTRKQDILLNNDMTREEKITILDDINLKINFLLEWKNG